MTSTLKTAKQNTAKVIKGGINKWKDITCSWTERLNIIRKPVLPKVIYRFIQPLSKSQQHFFSAEIKKYSS